MKVLVVEDEFYARKAMIRQIKKYDQDGLFEISEASNGEEGWEFCEKYKPELVLQIFVCLKWMGYSFFRRSAIMN